MDLSKFDILKINIQRAVSRCLFVFFGPTLYLLFYLKFQYRANELKKIRKKYKEIIRKTEGPIILCTNHLTLIDSIIQAIILCPLHEYFLKFKLLPWNFPEKRNFYHKFSWRILCYLGKCIPVQRMSGLKNSKTLLKKMEYLLNQGDLIAIFPEGKRSRDGHVDVKDFSYGIGELIKNCDNVTVICLYLRGIKQGGFANFPMKKEIFYAKLDSFSPTSNLSGLRKTKEISTQIVFKLKEMENEFFQIKDLCWQ